MDRRKNNRIEAVYEGWNRAVARFFYGMTVKERFLALSGFALTAIVSYFAAGKGIPFLPNGAGGGLCMPLGDALLCASGWTAPAVYLALMYSAYKLKTGFVPRAVALSLVFALRTVIGAGSGGKKNGKAGFYRIKTGTYLEKQTVKVGTAAAFSLLTVGMRLPSVQLGADTLPEILAMLFATPLLTAVLSGAFDGRSVFDAVNRRVLHLLYRELSVYALMILSVYAFKGNAFMGSSLATVSAIFLTVSTAVKGGTLRGAVTGALLGYTVSSVYAPIMTAVGVFSGILGGLGVAATVGISCAAGCFLAVYAYGYRAVLGYVPESIIAAAVTSPVLRYDFIGEDFPIPRRRVRGVGNAETVGVAEDRRITDIAEISEAFKSISGSVVDLRRGVPDAEEVCKRLREGFCDSCPLVCICWDERSGSRKKSFNAVKTRISRFCSPKNDGSAREEAGASDDLSNGLSDGFVCLRYKELNGEIGRLCGAPEMNRSGEAASFRGFFGECLRVSEILSDISENGSDRVLDPEATAKLKKAVSMLGMTAEGAAFYGGRIRTAVISGVNADWGSCRGERMERIADAVSESCGGRFEPCSDGCIVKDHRGKCELRFSSVPPLSTDYAFVQRKATGETENGDTAEALERDDGYFYSVLCDGMGSGEVAARCSENAVKTLKTLLRCGISPRLAVKLTGESVKDGYDECFTTLDLFSVDLTSGEATVLKSGAAVSYLLRNGETRQFSIPSLPLGIAYGTEPETVSFRLRAGDLFIAVSDGVAEEEADEIWLSEWLSDRADTLGGSARDIAERIMGAVESRTSEKVRRDDMTVAVVRISER